MGGCSSSGTLTANQMEGRLRAARATHSLSLKGLRLKAIPAEVLGLGDKLRSLDLSGNLNIDLAGVECLGSLRKLSVNGCKLVSLPPLASMTSLEELSAAHNSLSDLPSLPPSLLSLDASRNQLTTVPSGLAACDGLEVRAMGLGSCPCFVCSASSVMGPRSPHPRSRCPCRETKAWR